MPPLGRHVPVRWLIAGSYVTLALTTLLVCGLAAFTRTQADLWHASELRLRSQAESKWNRQPSMRQDVGTGHLPALPGFPSWAPQLALESSTADIRARVLLPDGTIVGEAGGPAAVPSVDVAQVLASGAALQAGQRGDRVYESRLGSERWQVVQIPLVEEGVGYIGLVQTLASLRPADELLLALRRYLIVGSCIAVLACIAVGLALGSVLARPLERLAATAARIAEWDLTARTGLGKGRNEAYAAAQTFDDMAGRLQEAFAAQRRFVADASHELKTPLTAVTGMAELLRVGVDEDQPEKRRQALRIIEREADRMNRLVADLLTLSRADQRPRIEQAPVDVAALVLEAAEQARLLSATPDIEVSANGPAWTAGDPDQLARVVRNLIDNAVKYSPAEGCVRLTAGVIGDEVVVSVADTGAGISPEDLPHVFDRFYRADAARNRKTGGSGLGLAIVRSIIEWHGGTVHIDSQPARGTTASFRLPLLRL